MKKIRYYDLLRVISFCLIIFYHMMVQLWLSDICPVDSVTPFFLNSNMHIATLAVTIFFMLSGACLAYTSKDRFDIKKFYKKRMVRILIPFYIVNLIMYLEKVVHARTLAVYPGIPLKRIIFTILGLDGWMSMHGYVTFFIGIGEWFLGCLIILYVLFPLFRMLMNKWPRLFFAVLTIVYIIYVLMYDKTISAKLDVAKHTALPLKGYEFILGMYMGRFFNTFNRKLAFVSIPVVLLFLLCPVSIPIDNAFKITIFAIAFYVSFSYLEKLLNKRPLRFIDIGSKYSYELFLVHHIIIYYITPIAKPFITNAFAGSGTAIGVLTIILLFIVQLICMVIATVIVKFISDKLVNLILKH